MTDSQYLSPSKAETPVLKLVQIQTVCVEFTVEYLPNDPHRRCEAFVDWDAVDDVYDAYLRLLELFLIIRAPYIGNYCNGNYVFEFRPKREDGCGALNPSGISAAPSSAVLNTVDYEVD